MKRVFRLIVIIVVWMSINIDTSGAAHIHVSHIVESKIKESDNDSIQQALLVLKSYLNEHPDSLLENKEDITIGAFKEAIGIIDGIAQDALDYFIIDVERIIDTYIFKMVLQLNYIYEDTEFKEIWCMANIKIRRNKICTDFINNLASYNHRKISNVDYYFDDTYKFDYPNAQSAISFIDSIASMLNINVNSLPRLNYLIATSTKAFKIFGCDYSSSAHGFFIKPNFMLSNCCGELYKHELIHYITQNYQMSKFWGEGIAVWAGGTERKSLSEFLKTLKKPDYSSISNTLKEIPGMDYFTYYYSVAGICVDLIYTEKGRNALIELINSDTRTSSPTEIVVKILNCSTEELINKIIKYYK